jgi:hypothetical protein
MIIFETINYNVRKLSLVIVFVFIITKAFTQDSAWLKNTRTSLILLSSIGKKTKRSTDNLNKQATKYLNRFEKQERKLKKLVLRKDSALANELFGLVDEDYRRLKDKSIKGSESVYNGHLDTLLTGFKYLQKLNPTDKKFETVITQLDDFQSSLNQVEQIKKHIISRKKLFKEQLGKIISIKQFQKDAYYFSAHIKECKASFSEASKLEEKAFSLLVQSPAFKQFFKENSKLGSFFALPSVTNTSSSVGMLQTRNSINQSIRERYGSNSDVSKHLRQSIQSAQNQINQIKRKIETSQQGSLTNGNSELPEHFNPNSQKTKPFLKRLEYGANIQSQKANRYFPVTSDIAMTVVYKLHDKSSIGIGISYKIGFGKGVENLNITHQGIGLRSYFDLKIKGALYVVGGYELNYRSLISSISELEQFNSWQSSGLIGFAKKYKVNKKLRGSVQLLWDYLCYQQIPTPQPIIFRIGYSLK